jgi:hypothetical protein
MKFLPFFLLTLLSSSPAWAVADFSGRWIAASGKVSGVVKGSCSKVEIEIEQKEGVLLTKIYDAACGLYGSSWGPVEQTIRDGKVFEGEEEVGTISEDTLLTTSRDGNVSYAYNLRLRPNPDGSLSLDTYYGVQNGAGAIVIEASLKKAQP